MMTLTDAALPEVTSREARRTSLAAVSRAPLARIEPYNRRMGWTFPWYSSFGSDFKYDFHVTHDEAVARVEYNCLGKAELLGRGEPWFTSGESHGVSVFLRDAKNVFHTYSTYARGADLLVGTFNYPDLTPLGRPGGLGGTVGPQRRAVPALGAPSRSLRIGGGRPGRGVAGDRFLLRFRSAPRAIPTH